MKHVWKVMMSLVMMMGSFMVIAQSSATDERMNQDIEVAENILGTLLRQQSGRRGFFPMEVSGSYVPGHGVTFRIPMGNGFNRMLITEFMEPEIAFGDGGRGFSYSYSNEGELREKEREARDRLREARENEREARENEREAIENERQAREDRELTRIREVEKARTAKAGKNSSDSITVEANKRFMEVAKNFLADYGDVISGLKPDEKVIISNRSEGFDNGFVVVWMGASRGKQQLLSVEAKRSDMDLLKQAKISRAEFLNRLIIVNTETVDELDPDLEVLSSMFGRLYREDLSKTYYVQGNLRYERLKDFGAVFYMKVYSSIEEQDEQFAIPTLSLRDLPRAERDKQVKDLYPKFESELKANLIDYGRTLRSLKDNEQLVFNVKITTCVKCGIPASLEVSIKGAALKEYNSGKASKEATLAKMNVKKIGVQ